MATIIFDFDNTLYNTSKLKEDLFKIFLEHNISQKDINSSYSRVLRTSGYSYEKHLQILNSLYKDLPAKAIIKKIKLLKLELYVFPGRIQLLNSLSKKNHLILLTKGDLKFQKLKIKKSKLGKYFKKIIITNENKVKTLRKTNFKNPIYFINDNEKENHEIAIKNPNFFIIKNKNGGPIKVLRTKI